MPAPLPTFSTGSLYLYGLERCFALAAEPGFDGVAVLEVNPGSLEAAGEAKMRRNLQEAAAFCRQALRANGAAG